MRTIDADFVLDGIRYIINDSNEMVTSAVVRNAMISLVNRAKTVDIDWTKHETTTGGDSKSVTFNPVYPTGATVDAVEVVRCGQCKHRPEYDGPNHIVFS